MNIYILFLVLFISLLYIIYLHKNNIQEIYSNKNNNQLLFLNNNQEKYTAIIIEPRKHAALEYVLENFVKNLDYNWNFIIFHGNLNEEYVKNIVNYKLSNYKNRITLKNLSVDNLTINDYNKILVSKKIYDDIPTEVFLIFQTDSIICKEYKDLINFYIKYDYVGAPWMHHTKIGNGGLSLRRKSKMLEIINNCKYDNEPEDMYFSLSCPYIYRNKPSFDDAKKFSVETIYSDISFGVHKPWTHFKDEEMKKKNNSCKGLDKLMILNK